MKKRELPPGYIAVDADFHFAYTFSKGRCSRYGIGHFDEPPRNLWKRVAIYNDKWIPLDVFWVNPYGELFSGRLGRILKADPPLNSRRNRYPSYKIRCTDGKQHHMAAHILVGNAFLPDTYKQLVPYFNHRNGDKTDSELPNVERTTLALNAQHSREVLHPKP